MSRSSMTRLSRRVARSPGERLSYGHLLWANAILSWIPVLLVLRVTEPPATLDRGKKRAEELKELLSTTLVRDGATRLVLLNMVAWGTGGLVMFWVNQKYWQESGVPLAWPLSESC